MHTKQTCQELAGTLDFAPATTCSQIKADNPIDIESYCGCQGAAEFTSWCKFCPGGTTNIYHEVTIPSFNYMSCGDIEKYAAYVTDPDSCYKMDHLANLCCGTLDRYWRRDWTGPYARRDGGDDRESREEEQWQMGSGDGDGGRRRLGSVGGDRR